MSMHAASPSAMNLEPMIEMNMTPLIDVLLVLIIMMIITIPRQQHAIELGLGGESRLNEVPTVVTLDVDFDGALSWNGSAVADRAELDSKLAGIAQASERTELHVRANKLVPYKVVAGVMASAQRQGVSNIGMVGNEQFM